jgi:hypothetical protein
MIPRIELLKIAMAHAESGTGFVYDDRGIPVFFHEGRKCMIGAFIPASLIFAVEMNRMNIYEIRDAGFFTHEEFPFIKEMDEVNILEDDEWPDAIAEMIDDER